MNEARRTTPSPPGPSIRSSRRRSDCTDVVPIIEASLPWATRRRSPTAAPTMNDVVPIDEAATTTGELPAFIKGKTNHA